MAGLLFLPTYLWQMRYCMPALALLLTMAAKAQMKWTNVDSLYQPLPASVHVFRSTDSVDGKPGIAYYVVADLKDRSIDFTADTSAGRRLTPEQFYQKNGSPLVVVNCTFFSFETNKNLNAVMAGGKLLSSNQQSVALRGKDTLKYAHLVPSAIGISRKRKADVAWTFSPAGQRKLYAVQSAQSAVIDSVSDWSLSDAKHRYSFITNDGQQIQLLKRWRMQTVVGGGPVLLQDGQVRIANNEERKFMNKAVNDRHPRTAMGYTSDGKLIIMAVQGRFPQQAEGTSLVHLAAMLQELGCVEALNLDGGGSSCLLVNGKETIRPSDSGGKQRPVPAVFLIK